MKANIEKILTKTCSVFGVEIEELRSLKRDRPIFYARMISAKHIYELCDISTIEVGKIINRSHTAILRYLCLYDQEYHYNKEFRIFADKVKDIDLEVRTDFQEELEGELNEIIG